MLPFPKETNSEGMTWEEWLNAAMAFNRRDRDCFDGPIARPGMRKAWRAGEDPTEHAVVRMQEESI